ncbi:MAG TPA: hypothetical protein VFI13_06555 [Gemmatimonadales bacterium]|nr:hypothetical protein [Gemmatimonadales bacterium]
MRSHYLALSALLVLAPALAAQAHDFAPYLIADRAEEVALARSAAPATISGAATIYVMTDTGFAEAAKGSNGFTCLVIRSFLMPGADSATTWEPRLRAPHCYNATAARTIVPNVLYRAHAVFRGVSPARVEAGVRSAYASHRWPLTRAGAIAYMLSPGQWLGPNDPHWKPHMMFFLPAGHPASTWGADKSTDAPVIDAGSYPFASPGGFILIPVERWSDGTPYSPAGDGAHQH